MSNFHNWRKIKKEDIIRAEEMLRSVEDNYVSACGRFLTRQEAGAEIWTLSGKNNELAALAVHSRSTVIPVLRRNLNVPKPDFLGSFFRIKKIHSLQGLTDEVSVFEETMRKLRREPSEIFDYDLMSLDKMPTQSGMLPGPKNLILRKPELIDLDALSPLQEAYEKEEVLPKGSVYSELASRVNLSNIIAQGRILAAELNGKLIGKINVSAVSFTRYQVGGVYVKPEFRKQGIAKRMALEFISSLMKEVRGITLFVKKNNIPARKLYLGLGFSVKNDYRITYY